MSGPVTLERDGEIAVIEIESPPVNAVAHPVRVGLLDAIERAEADAQVAAIVIHGRGRTFIAGADIREFDAGPRAPLLNDVLLRLESCRKPVIAALSLTIVRFRSCTAVPARSISARWQP